MQVKQIYTLVNDATKSVLGETAVLTEDLSNLVDVGTALFNANAVDNYVRTLVDRIGKIIFVDRKYSGRAPSVLMDEWEYGSVVEKISVDLPDAEENDSWQLVDGLSVDQDTFKAPTVSVKFFNSKTTYEVDVSITEEQIKESFTSAMEMNKFISMIFNQIQNSITVKTDAVIMRTINNFIGETHYAGKAINLLPIYNTAYGTSLTVAQAIVDKGFLRYVALVMKQYVDRLGTMSRLFNLGGKARFTPRDRLKIVMHSELESGVSVLLQSDTFHEELVKLPQADTVVCWQGTGTSYAFADTSKIDVTTADGHSVQLDGILCVMFDRDALGVCNRNKRVPTHYNGKGEFINYFYKEDGMYFNDFDENFVVFYIK